MLKLCFVKDQWAYFSPQEPVELFFEDWDDIPYEYNAARPYGSDIVRVAYDAPVDTPSQLYGESRYSARQINHGAIAWLSPAPYDNVPNGQYICAGISLEDFKAAIKAMGGEVYVREE